MRIKSKRYLSFIVALALCLSIGVTASATSVDTESTGPSELFSEICDNFFAESSTYRAIDNTGADITQSFYDENISYYISGQLSNIWDTFVEEEYQFTWIEEENVTPSLRNGTVTPQLIMNKSAKEYFYCVPTTSGVGHFPGTEFEVMYSVSGTYQVNDYNFTISSYSNAVLNIEAVGGVGSLFSYEITNISTSTSINSNRTAVTFSASFNYVISFQENYTGATLWTETKGPYSGSAIGYGNS